MSDWIGGKNLSGPKIRQLSPQELAQYSADIMRSHDLESRACAIALESRTRHAVPILDRFTNAEGEDRKLIVLDVIIRNFPNPSDDVPWESILEFRSDESARGKLLDLRNWVGEMSRSNLTETELSEKLEWLLSSYERHLQLHRITTEYGMLETVVVATAECLENLVRLKFSKMAKALFSIKKRRVALLREELRSPGSELAYIAAAKHYFA